MKTSIKNIIPAGMLIIFFLIKGNAQQIPHYTQYMYNQSIINPAYTGVRGDISIGVLGRKQWVGVEGAPTTATFSLGGRIADGLAAGISVVHDRLGLFRNTVLNLDISYTLVVSRYDRLAFGLKGGLNNYNNALSQGITPDNETYSDIKGSIANIGAGVFYYNKLFYAGFSVPAFANNVMFSNNNINTGAMDVNMFLTGGVLLEMQGDWLFKPSFALQYAYNNPLSLDINANFYYNKKWEFGASYRHGDSVSGMIAFVINEQFRIGYSYDYTLSDVGYYYGDSHEVMLLYDVNFKRRGRWLKDSSCYF